MQLTRLRVLLMLVLAVTSTGLTVWHFASATSAPSRNTTVEPGDHSVPCTYYVYIDSSKFVATDNNGVNTISSGSDAGAFLNSLGTANQKYCFENGIFTFTTTWAITQNYVNVQCSGPVDTVLRRTGNGDLIDSSGQFFTIQNCGLDTSVTQASGIGLSLTGYSAIVQNVVIGAVTSAQQFYFTCIKDQSQYSLIIGVSTDNCVSSAIWLTGGTNDMRVSQTTIVNWGTNIFATNPVGILIDNTLAAFISDVTVSQCDPGIKVSPGNGQVVTESFFQDVNIDSNWGIGFQAQPSGTGIIKQLHFTNIWANSNLKKANPTDNPSVLFQSVNATTIDGGEVAGNQWEGMIINGTSTDFDFHGVQVRDNNQGNHLGADGFFAGAPTPNAFVNGANLRFRFIGGAFDNPAIGGPAGKAGGLYISVCQNCHIDTATFLTGAGAAMTNPYGCNTCTNILMTNNPGFNPPAIRSQTAGASIYTFTDLDSVYEQLLLITVNGLSSWTCRGITQSNVVGTYSVMLSPFTVPNNYSTCAITWVTTAPVFEVMPQ